MAHKQPKPEQLNLVSTEIQSDFYQIKNWVTDEWSPILAGNGIWLYNIYSAAANKDRGNSWYFSLNMLVEFTGLGRPTISMCNWLLVVCGLIRIEAGRDGYANEYIICYPPRVTPEVLSQLLTVLETPADVGSRWQEHKKLVAKRIRNWKPRHECGKISQYKRSLIESQKKAGQQDLFTSTNDSKPEPATEPATDPDPLIQRLVARFAEAKPKLTPKGAKRMVEQYGAEAVTRQLDWLHLRDSAENPLRTLRASLKHDWAIPDSSPEPAAWPDDEFDSTPSTNDHQPTEPPAKSQNPELQKQWAEVLGQLQESMTQAMFEGWLRETELASIEGNMWTVACPNSFVKDWLENRLVKNISQAVRSVADSDVELKFVCNEKSK